MTSHHLKNHFRFRWFFVAVVTLTHLARAEQRQGNLVEYFGKEKVETIQEGELVHVFQRGLVLTRAGARGAAVTSSTPRDEVFSRFLFGLPTEIESNPIFDVDFAGRPVQWETITTNDKNTFEDRRLRSGVLYLTYVSESEQTILLDASGHSRLLIDGLPHEGDHYDFGWNLIPLRLSPGKHEFVLHGGRFGRMRARLIAPSAPVQLTKRDMTLPDIRKEESQALLGAIRVINAKSVELESASIQCRRGDQVSEMPVPRIAPMLARKVPFKIPAVEIPGDETKRIDFDLVLVGKDGQTLSSEMIELNVRSNQKHHKRTFVSDIDGSVQYFSVAPASASDLEKPALFLSVHGASVEATNQAAAYQQKRWGHLVAPTNRRPFGFAWEEWGRLDALEVLAEAERIYKTDPDRTYLTGHSMGGHGTWYLGATYPDRFAAIAPCAGYPDLLMYRGGFLKRMGAMSTDQRRRFGVTEKMLDRMRAVNESKSVFDEIVKRAGNPSRTLKLIENYSQHGVYVLHGENDTVVPTDLARDMRRRLAEFHRDFAYYEYPGGSHWYGNHSVDWKPIFDFFAARSIPPSHELQKFSFHTASPGVSASSHFLTIVQQEKPLAMSSVDFERTEKAAQIATDNVSKLTINVAEIQLAEQQSLQVDDQVIVVELQGEELHLDKRDGQWNRMPERASFKDKGPHRYGGFKDAFRNNMVLVYGTEGTVAENAWYFNRARFDAEKFWYRANGNVEIVSDATFLTSDYSDQNVILYGNRDNNGCWEKLLKDCPIQVSKGKFVIGDLSLSGSGWGAYFIYPRPDSDVASVGVVTASGSDGMKAAYANHYLVNGTCFPDVMIFDQNLLTNGIRALKCAGFWGNQWDFETGDFVWR